MSSITLLQVFAVVVLLAVLYLERGISHAAKECHQ